MKRFRTPGAAAAAPAPQAQEKPAPARPRFHYSLGSLMFVTFVACLGAAGYQYLVRADEQVGISRLAFVLFPLLAPAAFLLAAVAWQAAWNWRGRR